MNPAAPRSGLLARMLRNLRPSHQHSALSATLLLMAAVMLSRLIGFLRESYIAWAFGAGPVVDAYVDAFTLPDWLNYILAGGTASITFISIFARYIAQGRERDAEEAFSSTVTIMALVFCFGTLLLEIFTRPIERIMFPGLPMEQLDLCVHLTRILLPAQIFFYIGGIVSAVMLSQRMFLYPAFSPLLYNVFIILGGLVGAHTFGIQSLAWGALAGSFIGPFLINAIGAAQAGLRYHFNLDWRNPAFREWVRLSIPLMLGVSLVSADDWILRHFASGGAGDVSRLNYAKRLFLVPIAILGQATGQASLPFFAKLFSEGRLKQFATAVNDSVYRITAASLLAAGLMISAAMPAVEIAYRHGHFTFHDSETTAAYLVWFSLSLALWSAQALYARAFYAAGNTLTPMVASTLVVLASLPVYATLFHRLDVTGLVIASDIGILMHTIVLAVLLDRRKLVPLADMQWLELGKALVTAAAAAIAGYAAAQILPLHGSRRADLLSLALVSVTWLVVVVAGLRITRSRLPGELRRRKAVEPNPPPPREREEWPSGTTEL